MTGTATSRTGLPRSSGRSTRTRETARFTSLGRTGHGAADLPEPVPRPSLGWLAAAAIHCVASWAETRLSKGSAVATWYQLPSTGTQVPALW